MTLAYSYVTGYLLLGVGNRLAGGFLDKVRDGG